MSERWHWENSLDDVLAYDSDREGEEDYDLDGMCKPCFNGRHKSCKQSQCKCFREHSPVFHPKKEGRLILKMEQY